MKPLISIQTVPISIEYKINKAKVERVSERMDVNISRKKGGFNMKSRPIRVNVDTFEARNSIVPTPATGVRESAQRGIDTVRKTIAKFAEEGHMLVNNTGGPEIFDQIFEMKTVDDREFVLAFIPKYPAEITWTPPDLEMEYELDKLTFNWHTNQGQFEFIPASIEAKINEYPRVIIDYIGEPIYIPPSANPNYVPIDTKG